MTELDDIDDATPAEAVVAWSLARFRGRRLVLTTSFGLEGCALIDLYAAHAKPPMVVYGDTGFLFPETYALRDRMIARYPHVAFVRCAPALSPEAQAERFGPALWTRDPDRCCRLRKLDPLGAVLARADVWITAITRSQSAARASTPLVGWDAAHEMIKLSPLAAWDRARVWEYVRRRGVPYNPLHERGYPSIGCTHCTRPVPGAGVTDYSREGRWSGLDKTECGLHLPSPPAAGDSRDRRPIV